MKNWVVGATLVAAVICALRLGLPGSSELKAGSSEPKAAAREDGGAAASGAENAGRADSEADPEHAFPVLRSDAPAASTEPAAPETAPVRSSELDRALAAYRRGDHKEAARLLAPLVEAGEGLPASRVFLAAAALECADYATAREAARRAAAEGEPPSWRLEAEVLLLHCDVREGVRSRSETIEAARARLGEIANSPSGRLLLQDLVERSVAAGSNAGAAGSNAGAAGSNAGAVGPGTGAAGSDAGAAAEGMQLAQAGIEQVARTVEGHAGYPRVRGLAASLEHAQREALLTRNSKLWTARAVIGSGEPLARVVQRLRREAVAGRYDACFLAWANRIPDPQRVRAGQELVVPQGDLSIEVFTGSRLVLVYCGEHLVRVHGCAIGRAEKPTPKGSFEIGEKIERPVWHGPRGPVSYGVPENPLGEGWLGFVDRPDASGYGIHGTNDEGSIGTEASEGCIRLYNAAIVELMTWVAPTGTQVTIH